MREPILLCSPKFPTAVLNVESRAHQGAIKVCMKIFLIIRRNLRDCPSIISCLCIAAKWVYLKNNWVGKIRVLYILEWYQPWFWVMLVVPSFVFKSFTISFYFKTLPMLHVSLDLHVPTTSPLWNIYTAKERHSTQSTYTLNLSLHSVLNKNLIGWSISRL